MSKAAKPAVKLILVGPSGVGKTSLVSSFFNQQFECQTVATVAPAFCSATVALENGDSVELQIWDTAGQEQYQSISQMFYRDSHVALVCFEMTCHDVVEQWVDRVRSHVPDCQIILVATKTDLYSDDEVSKYREMEPELRAQFDAKASFMTSASTGLAVKDAFNEGAKLGMGVQKTEKPSVDVANKGSGKQGCC